MSVNDFQSDVHQAVDLGFAAADLIASFFSSQADQRRPNMHVLHTSESGSQVILTLDQNNQPILACTGTPNMVAVIVPTSAQVEATPVQGQVAAQPVVLQGGTQILFSAFPSYTKGMVTATQVDHSAPTDATPLPVCAVTMRDFSSAQQMPLLTNGGTPQISLDVGANSFTVHNADPANPYLYAATITTTSPNQTFTLTSGVGPGGQTTTPFPDNIGAAVIGQMSIVLTTVPNGGYQLTATPGSAPYTPPPSNRM